jgi:hypothetical protein
VRARRLACTVAESLASFGIRSLDRLARSESLYRLSYPGQHTNNAKGRRGQQNNNSTNDIKNKNKPRSVNPLLYITQRYKLEYRGADKCLTLPGRKQSTATEDFDVHISYLLS